MNKTDHKINTAERLKTLSPLDQKMLDFTLDRRNDNERIRKEIKELGGELILLECFLPCTHTPLERDGNEGVAVESFGGITQYLSDLGRESLIKSLVEWGTESINTAQIIMEVSERVKKYSKDNLMEMIGDHVRGMIKREIGIDLPPLSNFLKDDN